MRLLGAATATVAVTASAGCFSNASGPERDIRPDARGRCPFVDPFTREGPTGLTEISDTGQLTLGLKRYQNLAVYRAGVAAKAVSDNPAVVRRMGYYRQRTRSNGPIEAITEFSVVGAGMAAVTLTSGTRTYTVTVRAFC